jgi:hypothetical protein
MMTFAVGFGTLILLVICAWPKRRRPPVTQPPKPEGWDDRGYAAAHGIPLNKWAALPPKRKRELRLSAAHALRKDSA